MISVTCGVCQHSDDLTLFTSTPMFGDLPPGEFQCPRCHTAWRRKESGYRVVRAGSEAMFIPERVEIIPMEARI